MLFRVRDTRNNKIKLKLKVVPVYLPNISVLLENLEIIAKISKMPTKKRKILR